MSGLDEESLLAMDSLLSEGLLWIVQTGSLSESLAVDARSASNDFTGSPKKEMPEESSPFVRTTDLSSMSCVLDSVEPVKSRFRPGTTTTLRFQCPPAVFATSSQQ
jgi:hypothetical protein